jgi:DNA gyrase subunit A
MLLNAAPPSPRSQGPVDTQIADAPTMVVLSTTGRAVRVDLEPGQVLSPASRRSKHDAILATLSTTTRTEVGAVTTADACCASPRWICPPCRPPRCIWRRACRCATHRLLDKSERILSLVRFDDDTRSRRHARES